MREHGGEHLHACATLATFRRSESARPCVACSKCGQTAPTSRFANGAPLPPSFFSFPTWMAFSFDASCRPADRNAFCTTTLPRYHLFARLTNCTGPQPVPRAHVGVVVAALGASADEVRQQCVSGPTPRARRSAVSASWPGEQPASRRRGTPSERVRASSGQCGPSRCSPGAAQRPSLRGRRGEPLWSDRGRHPAEGGRAGRAAAERGERRHRPGQSDVGRTPPHRCA